MKTLHLSLVCLMISCTPKQPTQTTLNSSMSSSGTKAEKLKAPSPGDAEAFLKEVEKGLLSRWIATDRASWVRSTYITHDTEILAAKAQEEVMAFVSAVIPQTVKFAQAALSPTNQRKLMLLKLSQSLPAPNDSSKRGELAQISSSLEGIYGKGKYCPERLNGKCLNLLEISTILEKSKDYEELLDVWQGWHAIAKPMRQAFARYVELANEGAKELGFADLGDLWKSRYDMSAKDFEKEIERLWGEVKPLYQALHCYARGKLQTKFGKNRIPDQGPIPAHVFGNMWSQEWSSLYELLAPPKSGSLDIEKALKAKKTTEEKMAEYGEAFFVSLGLDKLPKTFWERSMFRKPKDREVVCHASAWDVDWDKDIRIKMCIKINEEDFTTIHHELGHNYYQYYYRHLDPLFRDSANDGFHEAIGDTIALSITPTYYKKLGLLSHSPKDDIGPLLKRALEKVAFLPFGLVVDKWRWEVFSGKIKPADYNKSWWALRNKYQGVGAAAARTEEDFDPGAKYHVPANVPYTRYFLAAILQFQFHRGLCKLAGHQGPLHTCSIFENKQVGEKLKSMLAMGLSQPWTEAMKALIGETKMDANAIREYFAPLYQWLERQNKGRTCTW